MSKIPMFPNKFAILASILGVNVVAGNCLGSGTSQGFPSDYGGYIKTIFLYYRVWIFVDASGYGYIGITDTDNVPSAWKMIKYEA